MIPGDASTGAQPAAATSRRKTAMIVGASRGLGRAISLAFAREGFEVVTVSRSAMPAEHLVAGEGRIHQELADATLEATPVTLLERHDPDVVVLVAGAIPPMRTLSEQTWETFSLPWNIDVKMAFLWLRNVLRMPLRRGSRVMVVSSGAALGGSPLSGGYAGAKATQRFIASYAQDEAKRAGLDITISTVMPRFSPTTGVGQTAVRAYARQAGVTVKEYLRTFEASFGPSLTPEIAGDAMVRLAAEDSAVVAPAYLLTGAGLQKLG